MQHFHARGVLGHHDRQGGGAVWGVVGGSWDGAGLSPWHWGALGFASSSPSPPQGSPRANAAAGLGGFVMNSLYLPTSHASCSLLQKNNLTKIMPCGCSRGNVGGEGTRAQPRRGGWAMALSAWGTHGHQPGRGTARRPAPRSPERLRQGIPAPVAHPGCPQARCRGHSSPPARPRWVPAARRAAGGGPSRG